MLNLSVAIVMLLGAEPAFDPAAFVGTFKGSARNYECGPDGMTCSKDVTLSLVSKDGALSGHIKTENYQAELTRLLSSSTASCAHFSVPPQSSTPSNWCDQPESQWGVLKLCLARGKKKGEVTIQIQVTRGTPIANCQVMEDDWFYPVGRLVKQR